MPIYEYQCTNCCHHFDLMQKISDEPLKTCPECSDNTLIKLISAAGFQLKGTGWYATDFKNKTAAKTETSTKPDEAVKKTESASPSTNTNQGDK